MAKPKNEFVPLFNPHFFKDAFEVQIDTRPLAKEALLAPGIFFDDEFKQKVLRYVPSVIPAFAGPIYGADFATDMTTSEAYARTAGNILRPWEFIATLAFSIAHDCRTKKSKDKILRYDGNAANLFCVRARGRMVLVWVEMNTVMDHFEGIGVLGFQDLKSLLEDDLMDRTGDIRLFI